MPLVVRNKYWFEKHELKKLGNLRLNSLDPSQRMCIGAHEYVSHNGFLHLVKKRFEKKDATIKKLLTLVKILNERCFNNNNNNNCTDTTTTNTTVAASEGSTRKSSKSKRIGCTSADPEPLQTETAAAATNSDLDDYDYDDGTCAIDERGATPVTNNNNESELISDGADVDSFRESLTSVRVEPVVEKDENKFESEPSPPPPPPPPPPQPAMVDSAPQTLTPPATDIIDIDASVGIASTVNVDANDATDEFNLFKYLDFTDAESLTGATQDLHDTIEIIDLIQDCINPCMVDDSMYSSPLPTPPQSPLSSSISTIDEPPSPVSLPSLASLPTLAPESSSHSQSDESFDSNNNESSICSIYEDDYEVENYRKRAVESIIEYLNKLDDEEEGVVAAGGAKVSCDSKLKKRRGRVNAAVSPYNTRSRVSIKSSGRTHNQRRCSNFKLDDSSLMGGTIESRIDGDDSMSKSQVNGISGKSNDKGYNVTFANNYESRRVVGAINEPITINVDSNVDTSPPSLVSPPPPPQPHARTTTTTATGYENNSFDLMTDVNERYIIIYRKGVCGKVFGSIYGKYSYVYRKLHRIKGDVQVVFNTSITQPKRFWPRAVRDFKQSHKHLVFKCKNKSILRCKTYKASKVFIDFVKSRLEGLGLY